MRTVFTSMTPLPSHISRERAVQKLHDHAAMIEQNPLVIHYEQCQPSVNAPADEYQRTWYELTDRISFLPFLHGRVRYRANFEDTPHGIRTHVFAPMRVDIRSQWSVVDDQSHGQRQPGASMSKLYLQEEVDLRCPIGATRYVRKTLTRSHSELVARLMAE